jgi:hypothetical protein
LVGLDQRPGKRKMLWYPAQEQPARPLPINTLLGFCSRLAAGSIPAASILRKPGGAGLVEQPQLRVEDIRSKALEINKVANFCDL